MSYPSHVSLHRLLPLVLSGLLSACGGGGGSDSLSSSLNSSGSSNSNSSTGNIAPVASAGGERYWYTGTALSLDGSGSSDANGDSLTYQWTLDSAPLGSSASLSNAQNAVASLVPDVAGKYQLSLEVSDGQNTGTDTTTLVVAEWKMNNTQRSSYIKSGGTGVLVNVQSVTGDTSSITVDTTGIPDYSVMMTQDDIDTLNGRPKAATDFDTGVTTASPGDIIAFGQDIGYHITGPGCALGYWPPGPSCPTNQSRQDKLPVVPQPGSSDCSTSLGAIGIMLNGAAIYNWDDGDSYNKQDVWHNLAPVFEQYDVDVCQGHAQQAGEYHHHMYSGCVQDMIGDDGTAHSPIYGFAADGYPIYGPYYMQGVLAKSSWVKRDYSAGSPSGCGVDGARTCQLVDQYDLSKGTRAVTPGPGTSDTVTTQSGNTVSAVSGIFFEDYYYDASLAAQGGAYLDEHNGHDHDGLGYHYHVTAEMVNGKLQPVFPYQVGPTFYGQLPSGTFATCGH